MSSLAENPWKGKGSLVLSRVKQFDDLTEPPPPPLARTRTNSSLSARLVVLLNGVNSGSYQQLPKQLPRLRSLTKNLPSDHDGDLVHQGSRQAPLPRDVPSQDASRKVSASHKAPAHKAPAPLAEPPAMEPPAVEPPAMEPPSPASPPSTVPDTSTTSDLLELTIDDDFTFVPGPKLRTPPAPSAHPPGPRPFRLALGSKSALTPAPRTVPAQQKRRPVPNGLAPPGAPSEPRRVPLPIFSKFKVVPEKPLVVRNLPESAARPTVAVPSLPPQVVFAVCVVDFHHSRGPEIQHWISDYGDKLELFPQLPFLALPDGLHMFEETFLQFNVLYDFAHDRSPPVLDPQYDYSTVTTLFGCGCIRQIDSSKLKHNTSVTRLVVQKSIVVLSSQPLFNKIKEKVSIITRMYFDQADFDDIAILQQMTGSLNRDFGKYGEGEVGKWEVVVSQPNRGEELEREEAVRPFIRTPSKSEQPDRPPLPRSLLLRTPLNSTVVQQFASVPPDQPEDFAAAMDQLVSPSFNETDFYIHLNLRFFFLKFRSRLLKILKLLLLEKRVLVFSHNIDHLITFQLNLVLLIPHLLFNLNDCGLPFLANLSANLTKPALLDPNDRLSFLRFFGLPTQIFNEGGLFYPYTSLEQLADLQSRHIKFYLIGSSNQLLYDQRGLLADACINIDTSTLEILNPSLEPLLHLGSADKRFSDTLVGVVCKHFHQPSQFAGSDDYIRVQFEDYLLAMLSTIKFSEHTQKYGRPPGFDKLGMGDLHPFCEKFVAAWQGTKNHKVWRQQCHDHVFDVQTPQHVAMGLPNVPFYAKYLQYRIDEMVKEIELGDKQRKFIETHGEQVRVDWLGWRDWMFSRQ